MYISGCMEYGYLNNIGCAVFFSGILFQKQICFQVGLSKFLNVVAYNYQYFLRTENIDSFVLLIATCVI